ncbi:thioredoxin domain-containing protein [Duncaniella sp.]|uniref:thioredoxin family protein n=1 Tax=Duncaniella sp. TaxID=2518496 RepID=UPI0023C9C401|nr:thioredoxin domain-containing protein [Duncaniella sp.]MDE5904689.1 thioredoxin family protein [Duncaniella sp.]
MTFRHLTLSASLCLCLCLAACGNREKTSDSQTEDAAAAAPAKEAPLTAITPHETLPTIIDFNAVWCGPCQRFAPIFEEVSKEYQGKAIFLSVDVDRSSELARMFEVSSIPQLTVLMPDGTVKSTVGFMDKGQFIDFITPYLPK